MSFSNLSKEEQANTISHGIGAVLSLIGAIYYLFEGFQYGNTTQILSLLVFGLTLVLLYSFSMLYHSCMDGSKRQIIFQKLDHSAIYLLIAGSYTAFMIIGLNNSNGTVIIAINWLLAIIGIITEIYDLIKIRAISVILYIAMGWLIIFIIKDIFICFNITSLILLIAGGIFYTGGVYFYAHQKKTFFHTIWHIFVLLGSLCHYFSVLILLYQNI